MSKDKYQQVGFFRGKGVYVPLAGNDNRSISIEEDHGQLRALTEDEVFAWKATQFDLALTQRLEEERERAEEAAEEWYENIGHGLAYGAQHMPEVI